MGREACFSILAAVFVMAMVGLVSAAVGSANPAAGIAPPALADFAGAAVSSASPVATQEEYGPLTEDMVTDEMIETGGGMFNSGSCQRCHMPGGQGRGQWTPAAG